jgi:hypothetical protein
MLRVHGPSAVALGAAEDTLVGMAGDDVEVLVAEDADVAVAVMIEVADDGTEAVVDDEQETTSMDARRAAATRPTFTQPSLRRPRVDALEPQNR